MMYHDPFSRLFPCTFNLQSSLVHTDGYNRLVKIRTPTLSNHLKAMSSALPIFVPQPQPVLWRRKHMNPYDAMGLCRPQWNGWINPMWTTSNVNYWVLQCQAVFNHGEPSWSIWLPRQSNVQVTRCSRFSMLDVAIPTIDLQVGNG